MSETPVEKARFDKLETLFQQTILVEGFFGAIAFAGLILLLGNQAFVLNSTVGERWGITNLLYLHLLAAEYTFLSGVCVLAAGISLFALEDLKEMTLKGANRVWNVVRAEVVITFFGFMSTLYTTFNVVAEFLSNRVNEALIVVAFISLYVLTQARRQEPRKRKKKEDKRK